MAPCFHTVLGGYMANAEGQRARSPDPVKGRSSPCLGAAQRERGARVAFCGLWGSLIGGVGLRVPPLVFENSDAIGTGSRGPLGLVCDWRTVCGAWPDASVRVRVTARPGEAVDMI